MREVEKHVIKEGHEWFDYCTNITTVSRQLYNTAQFTQRQGFFYGWGSHSQAITKTGCTSSQGDVLNVRGM
ncbi:MAG: hypothetical protein V7L23_13580 [Nostoc sp.]|uniref:hypothetical protein n=1 Tax=Nostoc sp. TaxID=1180 RepID=UPI002FEFEC78